MFENLSESINKAIKNLKGQGKITEINVASTLKEIRRALVNADVSYKVAKEIINKIKEEAMGQEVLLAVSPGQLLTKVVKTELTNLMGGSKSDINLSSNPSIILVTGLQGSGKTTFCAKLANKLKNESKSVLLVACDVYRPAAVDQLKALGEQIGIEVYSGNNVENLKNENISSELDKKVDVKLKKETLSQNLYSEGSRVTKESTKDVIQIAKDAIVKAKKDHNKVIIIDTAGRLAIDDSMMQELIALKTSVNPNETLFVVDAMTGQDAINTAKTFDKSINFDGVVLTKLDGDTRGGAALTIKAVVNKPIKFIGTGEKIENLDIFHPDRMAGRILGMGDVISIVERAEQIYDEKEARKLTKRMAKNLFDFNDLREQIRKMSKLGSIKDIVGMLPGMQNKKLDEIDVDDDIFKKFNIMISSMTPYERTNPDILDHSRKNRIARGSGIPLEKINALINNFKNMCKMMKGFSRSKGSIDRMIETQPFKDGGI